jgi:hypothetical protein
MPCREGYRKMQRLFIKRCMQIKRKLFLFILLLFSIFCLLSYLSYYLLITNRSPFILKLVMGTVDLLAKGQHISDYQLNLKVFPERGSIAAGCDIRVNFSKDRRYIIFLLNDGLKIDSIKYNDRDIKAYRIWLINLLLLPEKNRKGDALTLNLAYEGGLRPLGFSDGYIKEKEFILRNEDLWYPMDFQGLFTFNIVGAIPVSITPVLPGKVIIPPTPPLIKVIIPPSPPFIKGGVGGIKQFIWESERPAPGFAVIGGYFNRLSKNVNGVAYNLYSPVYHSENMGKAIENIISCHELFKEQFGDDGLHSLTFVITPHAYRSYNHGSGIITLSKTDFVMMAHEIAHNWWGGTVYVNLLKWRGDGGQWLTEGFAEFSSLLAVEKILGRDAFLKELEKESFNPYKQRAIYSITTFDNLMDEERVKINHQMVYAKGAYILIMLREIMGEEKFMQAIREFFNEYRYKTSAAGDFQRVVERVGEVPLSWFFDLWLRGTGRLDYAVGDVNSIERNGSFITTAKILNKGGLKMQVETDVMAVTDKGKEFQKVFMDEKKATVVFETQSKVKKIIVDPFLKWADMERENNVRGF